MSDKISLLSPMTLGRKKLNNRIVFGPHRTNFAINNVPGERHIEYYKERARGGTGLIIVEGGNVIPFDCPYEKSINIWANEAGRGYKKIAYTVHQYNCLVIAQLNHYGGQSDSSITRRELWAPSPVLEVVSGEVPKVMEKEDIDEVILSFAKAAGKLCKTGLDGIEINAGQFSLLRQFLSPLTNFRTDEYGGSLENRLRFCIEVINSVRREIGLEFILGLRLCGDEYAPWGGLTPEDCSIIAKRICENCSIDYLAIEVGSLYSAHLTMASMRYPEDYAVLPAKLVANNVKVPVCATGSICSIELAESLLNEGIELIEMTRALIADPMLPNKLYNNAIKKIRPCILCNQGCYVHSGMNPELYCAINPAAGEETKYKGKLLYKKTQKRVVIIGGGPAGLEAAAVAAERGHKVILYERKSQYGGRLRLAAKVPGNERYQRVIDYLYNCCREHGVSFKLNTEFKEIMLEEEDPNIVIVATGSKPAKMPFESIISEEINVMRPEEVLEGRREVGNNVLIVDLEGGWQAVSVALFLIGKAQKIKIVSPEMYISPELSKNGEFIKWYQKAFQNGIEFIPQAVINKVTREAIEIKDIFSQTVSTLHGIETIVLAAFNYPEDELYKKIVHRGIEVWAIGDCVAPRNYGIAIREGYQVGLRI